MQSLRLHWLVLLLLAGLATASAQPARVYLVRHGEKPDEGDHLSPRGEERAAALAIALCLRPSFTDRGLPAALYGKKPADEAPSLRSVQTLVPLSKRLGLPVIDRFTIDKYPEMVREILSEKDLRGKVVVISWEHKRFPGMVREFGVTNGPDKWPSDLYDRIWVIDFNDGKPVFRDLPQRLLFGDSAT